MSWSRFPLVVVGLSFGIAAGCGSTSTSSDGVSGTPGLPPVTALAPETTVAPATTPGSTGSNGTAGSAPCTSAAITDGVAAQDPSVTSVDDFRCSGQWAYAKTPTTMLLLEANGPRWSTVDTGTACANQFLAADIRSIVC
jgi:hypothetical protein